MGCVLFVLSFFVCLFKQKTAYEVRISDWSSDVCSSDLLDQHATDPEGGRFLLRLEFQTPKLDVPRAALETAFREAVASRFTMDWRISYAADKPRMEIGRASCRERVWQYV